MAIELEVAATLYRSVDDALAGIIATGTANLMIGVGSLFGAFWLIERTIASMNWYFKGFNGILQEEIMNAIKSAFIIYSAFNVGWYLRVIVPAVNDMPTWTIQTLSGVPIGTNQVDALINAYINGVWEFIKNIDFDIFSNFKETLASIFVLLCFIVGGVPFLTVCVATLMTLKVAISLFLVVGPLFIAFGLFDQTRQYFWGWVSLIGGFMLTQIVFGIAIMLEIGFLNSYVITTDPNGIMSGSFKGAFAVLLYFGTFTAIATELPSYAASVMGGAPSGAHGLKNIMLKASGLGTATRMAGSLRNRIRSA